MSNATGPAKDPQVTIITLNRDQIRKKFKRALIVDDEDGYAHSVRQNLEFVGFDSTVVGSLDAAAQELVARQYPFIICDNIFVDRSRLRGSEFIRDHRELLGDGEVILMTGYPEKQIADIDLLTARGVKIIRKEVGAIDKLQSWCLGRAESIADSFTKTLEAGCSALAESAKDEKELEYVLFKKKPYLIERAESYLINYMKKIPNPELAQFVIMGEAYSPNSLIEEIKKGTDVSRELVDQFLDDLLD